MVKYGKCIPRSISVYLLEKCINFFKIKFKNQKKTSVKLIILVFGFFSVSNTNSKELKKKTF